MTRHGLMAEVDRLTAALREISEKDDYDTVIAGAIADQALADRSGGQLMQQKRFGFGQTDMTGACLINEHAGCREIYGRCVCNCHAPFDLTVARARVVEAAKAWVNTYWRTTYPDNDLASAVAELERLEAEAQPKFPDGSPNLGLCPLCDGSGIWKSRMCQTCAGSGKS